MTGTSTQYSSPADFDACKPVTVEVRTVTTAGTSPPAARGPATLADCTPKGSTLRLAPGSATVAVGDTIKVTIMIDVGDKPVNAVQANLSFRTPC